MSFGLRRTLWIMFLPSVLLACRGPLENALVLDQNWSYYVARYDEIVTPATLAGLDRNRFRPLADLSANLSLLEPGHGGYFILRTEFDLTGSPDAADANIEMPALLVGRVIRADRTYFNGRLIGRTGEFPPYSTKPFALSRLYPVPRESLRSIHNEVLIVLAVGIEGRLLDAPVFGDRVLLEKEVQARSVFHVYLPGFASLMCLFAAVPLLTIYSRRRSDRAYLYVGCASVCFAIGNANQVLWIIPDWAGWIVRSGLETAWERALLILLQLTLGFVALFIVDFLRRRRSWTTRLTLACVCVPIGLYSFLPEFVYMEARWTIAALSMGPMLVIFVVWIVASLRDRIPGTRALLVTTFVASLFVMHDVLALAIWRVGFQYFSSMAMPVFFIGLAWLLVDRFVLAHNTTEAMAKDLIRKERNLRTELKKRKSAELRLLTLATELSVSKMKILQDRAEPHYLYNTLHLVQSLIHKHPREAERALAILSESYQYFLDTSGRLVTEFDRDWAFASDYADLLHIRFGARVQVEFHRTGDFSGIEIPPVTVQPLLENAFRHGIQPTRRAGWIRVTAERLSGGAVIRVTDDGAGLSGKDSRALFSRSLGNIRDRMHFLYSLVNLRFITPPEGGLTVELSFLERREDAAETRAQSSRAPGESLA